MQFKPGKPISEELSAALRDHITRRDIADIAIETNVGTSTLRDVMYRTNSVTENNEQGVIMLTKRALDNCKKTGQKFVQQKEFLTEIAQ